MTSDSTPAFEIEKEALKTEIETGIQAGVDHLEAKTAKRKDADKYHNTRHLLKQYRKVAYAIQISEADMNVRMEMEHGTRLSTLEVNAELAGVDLSGSKLEGYARTVIRSKNMLQIIDNALNTVRMDPDHGELKNIVASFASWMKISPIKIQIKVLTKKADIGKHLSTIERDMESESNPKCRELQLDYYRLIQTIGSREAITRRFLVIFEYEAVTNRKPEYSEIVSALETTVQTARQYFLHCDNAVVTHDDENAFLLEILYTIFNRSTCEVKTVEQRIGELQLARRDTDITVPVSLKSVLAPDSIDLTHGSYVVMDGVYHA